MMMAPSKRWLAKDRLGLRSSAQGLPRRLDWRQEDVADASRASGRVPGKTVAMKQIEQDPGRFPVVHVQGIVRSCIGMNLRLTERLVTRLLEARLRAVGLSAAEFFLMAHIAAVESDSVGTLARQMGLEKSTLSSGVRGLERKGFVEIVVAEFDSRSREVRLTRKGEARLEAAMPVCRKIDREISTVVDRRQVARIADSMSALCRRYQD